ncbi:MAG: DUF2007 domain-containing protein [Verrucomicrobiota bacterium]
MRKIYENLDYTKVGHFKSILEEAGIEVFVKNQSSSSVMGEVPFTEVYPELWVMKEDNYARAEEILIAFRRTETESEVIEDWVCAHCESAVEAPLGECWNCGKTP